MYAVVGGAPSKVGSSGSFSDLQPAAARATKARPASRPVEKVRENKSARMQKSVSRRCCYGGARLHAAQPVYTPLQVNVMVANLFAGGSARVLKIGRASC